MDKPSPHMNLTTRSTLIRAADGDLTIVERARLACEIAKQFEKAGEYESAYEALTEFWPERTESPHIENLDSRTKAEVLLRTGALAGWLGGTNQVPNSYETAKNFITRGIEIFEELADDLKLAEAYKELAICYWREGAFDEARVHLRESLDRVKQGHNEIRAVVLIWLGLVEADAGRLHEALRRYDQAAPLVEATEDHAIKGTFHTQFGLAFRRLATPEDRADYVDRALIEYTAGSFHFEQAGHTRYHARVEGNLGFLQFTIGRYKDAHEHLDRARRLFLQLKDVGTAAQVDETRARTLLAENRLREAERTIKGAVKVLERGGQQAVLAEALTTQGTIAARMGSHTRAALLLQRAIVVAETVGDREGAGRARLTIVEELGSHTPLNQLAQIYEDAVDLLERSQDPATNKRLISCGRTVIEALLAEDRAEAPVTHVDSWKGFSMRKEVTKLEKILIERALRDAGGSVTTASQLLGFKHHQSLIGLINSRHRELLPQRSTVRRRRHHLFSEPKKSKKQSVLTNAEQQLRVLHVEDHKPITRLVKDTLGRGISGLELVLRVRSLVHRRNLPILMLASDDVEKEAWRAGVDAFLPKAEAGDRLAGTIERLSTKRSK
jgi:tetratricopeptide (TPR) repeat protein